MLYLRGEEINGKPAGVRPRHRWQDNIKMYLTEIGG
jgi:hypothetical protein